MELSEAEKKMLERLRQAVRDAQRLKEESAESLAQLEELIREAETLRAKKRAEANPNPPDESQNN